MVLVNSTATHAELVRAVQELSREFEDYRRKLQPSSSRGYQANANTTTVRTLDPDATTTAEIADMVMTLADDLKKTGIIQR